MKKLFTLKAVKTMLFTFVMVFTSQTAWADYGWYDVTLNIGGITTDPSKWSGNPEYPTDLGIAYDMTITSIAFNIWNDANDRGGANMYFSIYDANGEKVGDDQDIWLGGATRIEGKDHDFSVSYSTPVDLAAAVALILEEGNTYYIDVWAKTYGDSGDEWYSNNGANYHAKLTYAPTYTRSVSSGNFGTICLPFDATITGADVYKIASMVVAEPGKLTAINLNKVTGTLQAGHAYIFKATGSTLTATFSGAYAEAIDADGMLGNLSADDIVVPVGQQNYVVSENKIYEVVRSVSEGNKVTCGQYRAYITLNGIGVAKARGANFIGLDESTGIESVQSNNQPTAMFNLQGQRVTDAQKGLVIANGKKMLRK